MDCVDSVATSPTGDCTRCGQRLLLLHPGRTVCERCRLNRAPTPAPPAAAPARQPSTCAGCGTASFAIADDHCMPCRHALGLDARQSGDMSDESWKQLARGYDH